MTEKWFSFDPEGDGFVFHDSKSSAIDAFEKAEARHTRWAERDGYWPDTTEFVCYGVVSERMTATPEIDDNPNRITPEIRIKELTETLERVIAERDELLRLVEAFGTLFEAVHMAEEQWACVDYNRKRKAKQ